MRNYCQGAPAPVRRALLSRSWFCLLVAVLLLQAAARGQATQLDDILDRAQAAQSAGRYADAATAYGEAVAIDRHTAELWANLGLMDHLSGRYTDAVHSFTQALALKPALFMPQLFLGLDQLELGKPEIALGHLERARAIQPRDLNVSIALGRTYTALHKPSAAAAAYTAATQTDAASQNAWYGLGVASIALIEQDGGTLATHARESVWARALYADDLLEQSRPQEALETYRKVAALASPGERAIFAQTLKHTQNPQALSGSAPAVRGQILTALEPTNQPVPPCSSTANTRTPDRAMACLFLSGQDAASAAAAAVRLQQAPNDPEALFWSVKSNERRAVDALARFEQLAPQSAATYDLLGDLDRRRMEPDRALDQYAKALELAPNDAAALLGRAAALLSTGRLDEAIATAQEALSDTPDDPRFNLLMGEALVARHTYPEARPFLDKALVAATGDNVDPTVAAIAPRTYALKGRVEAEAGNTDQAIADMTRGLPSDKDGSLSFQLSRLYRRTGKLAEAQKAEANAKVLQSQRRLHAATAVQDAQTEPEPTVYP